jgi:hypothetical protein
VAPIAPRTFLKAALMFAASWGATSSEFIIFSHKHSGKIGHTIRPEPLTLVLLAGPAYAQNMGGKGGGKGRNSSPQNTEKPISKKEGR